MSSQAIRSVCVFCASSSRCDAIYHEHAFELGRQLALRGMQIVYGGGAVGSMGHLAAGAMQADGRVVGVIPRFMVDLEWGHTGIAELEVVADMHERKRLMLDRSDAVVALPGGSGTFDELMETLTLKRLGLRFHPIVLVNTNGFFDPLVRLLESSIDEGFMDTRHRDMWQVVDVPEDVPAALSGAPLWTADARSFATG